MFLTFVEGVSFVRPSSRLSIIHNSRGTEEVTTLRTEDWRRIYGITGKMEEDPINNFFSSKEVEDPKILYSVLSLDASASGEEIRKAYRKKALLLHPDKHSSKSETEREELNKEFQRVGFAYAVLNDDNRRKKSVCAFLPRSARLGRETDGV